MINDLGWTSLELRRGMFQLILICKMSHGLVDIDVNYYLQPYNSRIRTRGSHNYKFIQNKATKDE